MARESAQRHAEARERLEQAVTALARSDGWRAWIRTRATFRRYSLHNTILIAMQRPEATRVAGYRAWQRLGRQVRKGEKGIAILAPMVRKEKDEDGNDTGEVRTFFRAVWVFDVAQTAGDPLPELPREPITGASHAGLLPRLEAYAGRLGFAVTYQEAGAGALGYCDRAARRIVVSPDQPANARVRTRARQRDSTRAASRSPTSPTGATAALRRSKRTRRRSTSSRRSSNAPAESTRRRRAPNPSGGRPNRAPLRGRTVRGA
jgi:hypothetical protein